MSRWRDRLQPASFRGVQFVVESHDSEFGRRSVAHQFPRNDVPFIEDLGRAGRKINLIGFVIGDDYFTQRDALLDACEQDGPGKLVHPFLGELLVQCDKVRISEARDQGGMARFALEFTEAGKQIFPNAAVDTGRNVLNRATTMLSARSAAFASVFDVVNFPDFVRTEAETQLGQVLGVAGTLTGFVDDAVVFKSRLETLQANTALVVGTPGILADDFGSLVSGANSIDALLPLLDFANPSSGSVGTNSRIQITTNANATAAMIRQSALAQAAIVASKTVFVTHDEAVDVRDALSARMIDEADTIVDDALFAALSDLRGAVVADITARALDLPRLDTINVPQIEPSLVLAYRLYGDAQRDLEIVDRNAIIHPGFISPTQPLLVLNQ